MPPNDSQVPQLMEDDEGGGNNDDDYAEWKAKEQRDKLASEEPRDNEDAVDRMMNSLRIHVEDRLLLQSELDEGDVDEENAYYVDDDNMGTTNTSSTSTSTSMSTSGVISETAADRRSMNNVEAATQAHQRQQEPVYLHLPRKRPNFKLTEFVQDLIDTANNTTPQVFPEDADEPFDRHAQRANPEKEFRTKRQVIQELVDIMSVNHTTKKGVNSVFGVLQRNTDLNLPVKINARTGGQIFHWDKYLKKDKREKWIDLLDLYKISLGVMPDMFTYNDTRVKVEGALCDILDGSVPEKHLREMKLRFLDRKDQYARDNGGAILHELSLCLSGFYDGDKLYNRTDDSLWPYLISIMNCDPCFRTTLGLGLSLIFMHNLPVGSGAEQSVIDDMLTPELEQLFDGIVFKFHLPNGEQHAVFIQARLLFLHLDTRAQDKVWHISSAGGMCGCTFCADCKGLSRPIIGARVYPGASLFLPEQHMLKCIGESKKRYLPGYYGELGEEVNAQIGKDLSKQARAIKIRGKGGDAADSEFDDIVDENNVPEEAAPEPDRAGEAMEHSRPTHLRKGKIWFNDNFPWSDVAAACWCRFNDPASRNFKRVEHWEYLQNAHQAGINLNIYLEKCIRLNKTPAKNHHAKHAVFNGVHYPLSETAFSLDTTLLFENAVPDFMHQAGNAVDYDMKLIKGERGLDLNSRKLSLAEGLFGFLIDKDNQVPWTASLYTAVIGYESNYESNLEEG
eukprot:gene24023-30319_t